MKKLLYVLSVVFLLVGSGIAQTNGAWNAFAFGQYSTSISGGNGAVGSGTITVFSAGFIPVGGGNTFFPFTTTTPLLVGTGAAQEKVTPSAVANCNFIGQSTCTITATFSNVHYPGELVQSASHGLQEAINLANGAGGGQAVAGYDWVNAGGTAALLTATTGYSGAVIRDFSMLTNPEPVTWGWNGTAYAIVESAFLTTNFASLAPTCTDELLTLSTGGATTDTVGNLLPANSIILFVGGRVQTTITTATNWQLGDATTGGRFTAVDTVLTAGETVPKSTIPPVQWGTGVASATTGLYQASAAKVRVTTTGTPGAGKVRITVCAWKMAAATQ